jgi:hypothetical protein
LSSTRAGALDRCASKASSAAAAQNDVDSELFHAVHRSIDFPLGGTLGAHVSRLGEQTRSLGVSSGYKGRSESGPPRSHRRARDSQ